MSSFIKKLIAQTRAEFWSQKKDFISFTEEFQNLKEKSNKTRLEVLRNLFLDLHPDDIIDDAYQYGVEDVLREYESGDYICRFLPKGYQLSFISNFFIPPIQESLKAFGEKNLTIIDMHKAYQLMGTQTACVLLISKFLEESLKNNLEVYPDSFSHIEITLFAQHLYSVMISIIFSRKEKEEQFNMMNKIYPFNLSDDNIKLFLEKIKEYANYIKHDLDYQIEKKKYKDEFLKSFPQNDPGIFNWDGSDDIYKYLFSLQQEMYSKQFYSLAIDICNYSLQNVVKNNNEIIIFQDALGSIYRDLGIYTKAIEQFRRIRTYWEEKGNKYQIFLALKNEAFCYSKMGEISYSTQLFTQIEESFGNFKENELGPVYMNLAVRHQLLKNFQKAYKFFKIAFKHLPQDSKRYEEVKEAMQIYELCKKPNSSEIDYQKVDFAFREILFKRYIKKYIDNRDKLIPNIAEAFFNLAYDWKEKNFLDYYLELVDLAIMKYDYSQITSITRKLDPDIYAIPILYGLGLIQLNLGKIEIFWEILHQIYFIYLTSNSDFKDLITEDINWDNIQNPRFREKIMISLDKQLLEMISNENFLKKLIKEKELKENLISSTALAVLIRLQHFFLAEIPKERRNEWFKVRIDLLREKYNSIDLQILSMFKDYFKQRWDWINYEAILHLFLILQHNYLNLKEAGEYYYLIKQDFKKAIEFFKEALDLTKIFPDIFERLIELYILTEDFSSAENFVKQLSTSKFEGVKPTKSSEDWIKLIHTIKNSKIRYELIKNNEILKILHTLEFQIEQFYIHHQDYDFSILYTLFSKLIEKNLANTIGLEIVSMLLKKYSSPHKLYKSQPGRKNIYFSNFLENPNQNSPVLGNWKYLLKNYLESIPQKNQIIIDIYDFFKSHTYFNQEKIKNVLDLIESFKIERDKGTHTKLFPFDEIDNKLKEIIPLLNIFLEIIGNYLPSNL